MPYPSLGANHYGLRKPNWLDVARKPAGTLFTPIGGSQWLLINGQLWEGAFYFDGPDKNPSNDDSESLKWQYHDLARAKEFFEELATEAAAFLPSIMTPHRMVDHPRRAELWHRWLESLCAKVEVEPAGLHAFDVRRVPGNIFQASALFLESLDKPAIETTGDPAKPDELPIPERIEQLATTIESGTAERNAERFADEDRCQLRDAMEKAAEQVRHIDHVRTADFQDWERLIIEFVRTCRVAENCNCLPLHAGRS